MTFKLRQLTSSPVPFSWDSLTPPPSPKAASGPEVASLPSPPTSWLSAIDMKTYGPEPLKSRIGIVKCLECGKPVLRSAISEHAGNCNDIRSGKKWAKGKVDEVELKKGKKRDGEEIEDPAEPNKKKAKITKGRTKGPVDYDKQCGVINDKGLPCSRSLTCKAHSMGAKRAVEGRSKSYDELLLDWNRANNPNWVEPVKKETKAEKKEKKEREKAEKKRLAQEAAAATGGEVGKPKKSAKKATSSAVAATDSGKGAEGDNGAENLDEIDSEAEVDALVKGIHEARAKGQVGMPLAVPLNASSWFVARRERLRNCRDLLATALAPPMGRNGIAAGGGMMM
ncbi:SCA7-domain-containing protein [Coniophora puteana RWD-64-598 SS2]|uniref:SCA7-domain-containing protein n=1 Tax=Coniophora puteana (strain RWD-64-598) TaxID=741705 RepID=A0A5M3MU18_CONPW|nr:SCA7-domain-containing protein [Coniophora puteana RWD-64-598 SS2]EIW82061.1 SCA7-domain-containing protein [Coniophora puteana RWD-64-598 SS2]